MLECVVNVSEGRRLDVIDELATTCGSTVLDVHVDPDHHRSVFTLAGDVEAAVSRLEEAALRLVDISHHRGVHPRLGAVDVVPFVALDAGDTAQVERSVTTARRHAASLADRFGIPTFLYGAADPQGRSLPSLRREAFERRRPDFGPPEPHPTFGATAVGSRPVLVAVNYELAGDDIEAASGIARAVRESGGGLPGVRALAFPIASRSLVQVSMNLVALDRTGLSDALTAVRRLADEANLETHGVELVGLVPRSELASCSPELLEWSGLGDEQTIEARLEQAGLLGP